MGNTHSASLIEHLSVLEDPRIDRAKRHSLTDALTIAICAIVGGADSWTDVEMFGNSKRQWFDSFLELPRGRHNHVAAASQDVYRSGLMLIKSGDAARL